MADWLREFPTLEVGELRALKKSFDAGYRGFSREYGEAIEASSTPSSTSSSASSSSFSPRPGG